MSKRHAQRHYLVHEGAPVVEGLRYVLRSDVMYGPPGWIA